MARPAAKELTERELEVMQVFWKRGEITAAGSPRRAGHAPASTGPTPPWPR